MAERITKRKKCVSEAGDGGGLLLLIIHKSARHVGANSWRKQDLHISRVFLSLNVSFTHTHRRHRAEPRLQWLRKYRHPNRHFNQLKMTFNDESCCHLSPKELDWANKALFAGPSSGYRVSMVRGTVTRPSSTPYHLRAANLNTQRESNVDFPIWHPLLTLLCFRISNRA